MEGGPPVVSQLVSLLTVYVKYQAVRQLSSLMLIYVLSWFGELHGMSEPEC